ncbi:MAG: hypothetical protein MK108_17575 [Mariniblastus sp.]|nr:hypothetical protein [Mariniblastus sp.]
MKYGSPLVCLALLLLCGCGPVREQDPQFVGQWKSGLPYDAVLAGNTPLESRIKRTAVQTHRMRNARGDQWVRLDVRADGSFTMTVRMEMEGLQKIVDDLEQRGVELPAGELPDSENSYEGTWYSEGDAMVLTSEGILPYSNQLVTRKRPALGSLTSEHKTRSPYLRLNLRSNGNLSRFPDDVRPETHESELDFRRESD